jgi:hypothetical protein
VKELSSHGAKEFSIWKTTQQWENNDQVQWLKLQLATREITEWITHLLGKLTNGVKLWANLKQEYSLLLLDTLWNITLCPSRILQ